MHNNYCIRIWLHSAALVRGDCSRYDLLSNVESRSENDDNPPWADPIILFVINADKRWVILWLDVRIHVVITALSVVKMDLKAVRI